MLTKIAASTFTGPGTVLFQLMFLAVVGWLLEYLCMAVNKGTIAGMVKVVAVFIAIGLVAGEAWKAILAIAKLAGLS